MSTEVKKSSYTIQAPRELLLDAGVIEPTPAERAAAERYAAEAQQQEGERKAKLDAARQRLAALTDPLSRTILDLHSEDERGECERLRLRRVRGRAAELAMPHGRSRGRAPRDRAVSESTERENAGDELPKSLASEPEPWSCPAAHEPDCECADYIQMLTAQLDELWAEIYRHN